MLSESLTSPGGRCWRAAFQARCARSLALGALAWLSQSCLVTNDVDYDRPNTPALVRKILPADFTAVRDDCPNGRPGMNFTVSVYDPDVADALYARVLLNGSSILLTRITGTQAQRDDFSSCVSYDELNRECSHVEILVSNEFSEGQPAENPYDTLDPYDIGRVEWWLLGPADRYPEVGVRECQKLSEGQQ